MVRKAVKDAKRIVIKIGTTSITYPSGNINLRKMEGLARIISDLQNSGKEVVLVSSGAIGAGMDRMGFMQKPQELKEKQATAAVGQAILMQLYQKFFGEYNQSIAQILLTADVFGSKIKRTNTFNTFDTLFKFGVVPIVNENDAISTEEIQEECFGDNDTLSAMVAVLVNADLLMILSDVEGLYDCNPVKNPDAKLITYVEKMTEDLVSVAETTDSKVGTGGMITKLLASKITSRKGIHTILAGSKDLNKIYDILEGKEVGTFIK
ncbi:glutamate 5-kinase [Alkalibacter saccharofermentans]|uniref:Glutamate 5-kinase n=1 Tax=Alkalibacter saccharofermentans DSM 14828 TaxID=1120975 RepID=A0A1M4XLU2_9FIRM|nr:glutamate 5-kinase [Alkalibacter saccharofermentans]SHE94386.1 glutamate 5-kinase [Alkalibacter saccharofermentans DSM 14828]